MRVLLVSQHFWPEEFYINAVVTGLVRKGVEVDVLTGKPNYPEGFLYAGYDPIELSEEEWSGAHIFRVPIFLRGQKKANKLVLNYLSYIFSASILGAWLLRKRKYDLIFVYGTSPILQAIPGIFLSWRKKCKIIVWVQDLWPDSLKATGYIRNEHLLRCVKTVVGWIYRQSDLILVQSRAFVTRVKDLAPDVVVKYQPNSVNAVFSESKVDGASELNTQELDDSFTVVFAGNVGLGQSVDVIVEAATKLLSYPQIRFVVIGHGSRWEWMNEEVKSRQLSNFHMPGRFPIEVMPDFLNKASALLVTLGDEPILSLTIPNKIQAYMAIGRPIIACLNGEGARLVQESGSGFSVAANDVDGLVTAILRLYKMPQSERAAMGIAGRNYFLKHFKHETLLDNLIESFSDLISKRPA